MVCAQLTRDLFAIAKFLLTAISLLVLHVSKEHYGQNHNSGICCFRCAMAVYKLYFYASTASAGAEVYASCLVRP